MSRLKPGISKPTSAPPWNSAPNSRLASTMPTGWLRPIIATAMPVKPAPPTKSSSSLRVHAGDLVHADQPGQRARQRHRDHHLVRGACRRIAAAPALEPTVRRRSRRARATAAAYTPTAAASASSTLRLSGEDGHSMPSQPAPRACRAGAPRAPKAQALHRHAAGRLQQVDQQIDQQVLARKLNMMVVITTWLPRQACRQPGTAAQAMPNSAPRQQHQRQQQPARQVLATAPARPARCPGRRAWPGLRRRC